jgi:hypothetical protein
MALTKVTYSMIQGTPVNVLDYGAVGDGVTDNTAAIQAAINYIESITYSSENDGRPLLYFPSGRYLTGSLTFDKVMDIAGDGMSSTYIKLKTGETGSLFILNAENIAGTSIDDANHYGIRDMSLEGNRTDSTTTGSSRGIDCPATAWSLATQYSSSIIASNLDITGFTGDGIFLGDNRNWALMNNVIVRYCNDNALATYGFDHRITSCDFGVCKNFGVREYAGGANSFVGCNIYFNLENYVSNNSSGNFTSFVGCSFDGAKTNGVNIAGATGAKLFSNCRFSNNSTDSTGVYSDILVSGASCKVSVIGCVFTKSTTEVEFLVKTSSNPIVVWTNNRYNTVSDIPYATAITNVPLQLTLLGDDIWRVYAGGNAGFGGCTGPFKFQQYSVASLPSNAEGALIYVSDETGGPTLAFNNGTNWLRVRDNVIVS